MGKALIKELTRPLGVTKMALNGGGESPFRSSENNLNLSHEGLYPYSKAVVAFFNFSLKV